MLAHILTSSDRHHATSAWAVPACAAEQSRAEQSRAEQSRAEQSRGNAVLLAVCSEDCHTDEWADTLNRGAEQQGHSLLKEETYISSLPLHNREMRRKDVSISEYELDFFNIGYIFYIDDSRVRHSIFRDSYTPVPACSLRATHNLRTNRT